MMRRGVTLYSFIFWNMYSRLIMLTYGQLENGGMGFCIHQEEDHQESTLPPPPPYYDSYTMPNHEEELYDNGEISIHPKNTTVICENVIYFMGFSMCGTCWKLIYHNSNVSVIPTNRYQRSLMLKELYMAEVGIQKIEAGAFANLPSLAVLNLESNKLEKIVRGPFNSITSLNYLNLSHNIISEIEEESFHGSFNIQILDLSFNKIKSVENIFSYDSKISFLNLSNNLLTTIGQDFCASVPYLTNLIMDHNLLSSIPSCLEYSTVSHLSCNFNSITVLSNNNFPVSLETLYVGSNRINQMNLDVSAPFSNLRRLNISNNTLKKITPEYFKSFKFLEDLDISDLNLETISSESFSSMKSLRVLRIKNNNIHSLQRGVFRYLSNLTLLDLSKNKITSLQLGVLKDLGTLEVLYLSHNELDFLQSGVFNGMKMLEFIDLSWNRLKSLQFHILDSLMNLRRVDLRHNQIETLFIEHTIRSLQNILDVKLDGNNLTCATLAKIKSELRHEKLAVTLHSGETYSSENIDGISCEENAQDKYEQNREDIMADVKYFFQNDFRNTSFYNFFKNFGNTSNNNLSKEDFNTAVEILENNLTYVFTNNLNDHVKEFMRFENASFHSFLKELHVIVHRLEETDKNNKNISLEDLSETFKNEIKTFVSFENSSFQNFMNRLSDIVDQIVENQNLVRNVPNIIEKNNERNADKLTHSEENNGTTELIRAINQLKVFIMLCIFMAIVLVIGPKLLPYARKGYLRAESSGAQVHEMPILS